jgi:dihydroxyacid dehydratase/phosphogluconate dehydratase
MSPPRPRPGGTLALVQTGDEITLDVPGRRLTLEVSEGELLRRRPNAATLAGFANPVRGWERLYIEHVRQADTGADLDFLVGATGDRVSRDSH